MYFKALTLIKFTINIPFLNMKYLQNTLQYTPGRSYRGYKRERDIDIDGLKKWAKVQARQLSLYIRDKQEKFVKN